MPKSIDIFVDGASRGNPGPSGIGVVFFDENKNVVKRMFKFIGNTTNNIAEYAALIYGMQEALIDRYEKVSVSSDSELMTRQLRGEYKVKNENLRFYHEQFLHLSRGFDEVKIFTIGRKDNKEADRLANRALDARVDSSLKLE
ncbi:MAG: ribonuclease HI family protein [Candidatus Omnitrophica bacterium]|nr:ribonuclease HI family protein [Candidatus Omnitrophota bacterium]